MWYSYLPIKQKKKNTELHILLNPVVSPSKGKFVQYLQV